MGIEFYGKSADGKMIALDFEDPDFLSLNLGNGAAVLGLLALPCEDGYGECTLPEARRAIILARNTYTSRAVRFMREGSDTQEPGHARVISGGLDVQGLAQRVRRFERFVDAVEKLGAVGIYWA
jgi:hypothetical protein